MKIVLDFDSTIVNTSKTIHNIYKEERGDNSSNFNPKHDWDFKGLLPSDYVPRALELFTEKKFTDNLVPMENAIEVLTRLSEKHEIWICTKHHPLRVQYTEKWVRKNLPFAKVVYVTSFDKSIVCGDIYLDDRMDALDSVIDNFWYVLCYGDYNWNKEWEYMRITSWLQFEKFVNEERFITSFDRK